MPNKYDKPLFVALRELMKAKLYDAVNTVIECAILDNVPLAEMDEEPKVGGVTRTKSDNNQ